MADAQPSKSGLTGKSSPRKAGKSKNQTKTVDEEILAQLTEMKTDFDAKFKELENQLVELTNKMKTQMEDLANNMKKQMENLAKTMKK